VTAPHVGSSPRVRTRGAWAAALLLALGCHRTVMLPPAVAVATLSSSAAREWGTLRDSAQALARAGEHARADSLLSAFRDRYPGTPASSDALLWRGLLRADPASRVQSTRAAASDLEAYESGGTFNPFATQTPVIRRLLAQVDSLRLAVAAERNAASVLIPRDSLKPRDDEVLRLRAELEQARAELDRVRRRLAPRRRP
jgi:hypothetical protein